MKATNSLILSFLIAGLGAGCANNTQRGAAAGAATGAVLGGVIGHQSGEAKAGAAIGAAAGGLAGAAIGREADRDRVATTVPTTTDSRYVVREPPPMPASQPREPIPARPSQDAVWIEGHYVYTGTAQNPYEWVAGHWEIPPPGATRWVPAAWQRSGDGYIYVRGQWQ